MDILPAKLDKENSSNNDISQILLAFEQEFGGEIFNKWLSSLEIFEKSANEIIFSASSKFIRDWVMREFVETKKILKLLQNFYPKLKKVAVIHISKDIANDYLNNEFSEKKTTNLSKNDNVFAFGTELNSRFTFENFVSAKYNKLAVSMAKIAAGIDAQISLFDDKIPLFIHGGVGTGKTHLAQAIAWKIKEFNKKQKVVYLSAEKFMYHFVQSIRGNDIMGFKEKMRSIDVLIVDDLQFIAGKESTQQEFMNSFNCMVEDNKQVILVCDRCPSDLENIDEKLKSRISGGMVVNFKAPDYQDRLEILKAKTILMNQEIDVQVLSFVAEKVANSVRDLEGALKKLCAAKLFDEKEISLENTKSILSDYIKASNDNICDIKKIQKVIANFYSIKISDLESQNRSRNIARPRQIAMYFAKTLTKETLPQIGKEFGGKNHATVIHSFKLVKDLMVNDNKFLEEIKILEEKILNAPKVVDKKFKKSK